MIQVRLVFTLVFLAIWPLLLGILSRMDPSATNPVSWPTMGVSLVVVVGGLVYESRRDFWRAASFVMWMCLVPVVVAGVIVGVGESTSSRLRAVAVGVPFLLLGTAALVFVIRNQFAKDDVPSPLLARFSKANIWEAEGVQWSALTNTTVVAADGAIVSIFLQSCVAATRRVTITLQDSAGFMMRAGGLGWAPLGPVELGPGEVGVLHVPIAPTGARQGPVHVYIVVEASGPTGKRVRRWHARVGDRRISPWLTVLGVIGGVVKWGGGVRLTFSVFGTPTVPAAARWEQLWTQPP